MLGTVLLAFAFVFGCFASFGVASLGRFQLGWVALTLLIASMLFGRFL